MEAFIHSKGIVPSQVQSVFGGKIGCSCSPRGGGKIVHEGQGVQNGTCKHCELWGHDNGIQLCPGCHEKTRAVVIPDP